jgi:hypothetical protein
MSRHPAVAVPDFRQSAYDYAPYFNLFCTAKRRSLT